MRRCAVASTIWADMLDSLEIRKEITRLEYEPSSYPNYAKLATLYTIRAEMNKGEPQAMAHQKERSFPEYSGAAGSSNFLSAVADKDSNSVWHVMDELMESLSVMQPKVYAAVMSKITTL